MFNSTAASRLRYDEMDDNITGVESEGGRVTSERRERIINFNCQVQGGDFAPRGSLAAFQQTNAPLGDCDRSRGPGGGGWLVSFEQPATSTLRTPVVAEAVRYRRWRLRISNGPRIEFVRRGKQ